MSAKLFVGNISSEADAKCLRRLFSAYGNVLDCEVLSPAGAPTSRYALITYTSPDDADCAIAALHLRYRMAPQESMIVLYHKESKKVTEYGRRVGSEYRAALEHGAPPKPIPLAQFDGSFARTQVMVPQMDFPRPLGPMFGLPSTQGYSVEATPS
jgi:hypothetical protein